MNQFPLGWEVVSPLGVVVKTSFSFDSCALYARKHGWDTHETVRPVMAEYNEFTAEVEDFYV